MFCVCFSMFFRLYMNVLYTTIEYVYIYIFIYINVFISSLTKILKLTSQGIKTPPNWRWLGSAGAWCLSCPHEVEKSGHWGPSDKILVANRFLIDIHDHR